MPNNDDIQTLQANNCNQCNIASQCNVRVDLHDGGSLSKNVMYDYFNTENIDANSTCVYKENQNQGTLF